MPPRIAIVGGGPAGLTLGLLLHKNRIPFTIFELRKKPTEEELAKPSGMLDLHLESGLTAIKACGLYDSFMPLTGECTEQFVVATKSGQVLYTSKGDSTRPEISRNNLTRLLVGGIPPENIKWSHKLLAAFAQDHNRTELDFGADGKHTFDFVVGADGAWSKVRPLLTDVRPNYMGMQNITLTIRNITTKYPHLSKLVGSGTFSALGNRHAVVSQRGSIDSARIYVWLTRLGEDFPVASGLAGKPALEAKHKLFSDEALLGAFGGPVKELVSTACDEETLDNPGAPIDLRALHSIPHGSSWVHRPGATLIGDAAHLMLPNGEGVNFAMLDALLLSQAVIKAYANESFSSALGPLLKDFEEDMVERAKAVGKETDGMMEMMMDSDNAAQNMVQFFKDMGA